ncbi:MAG: bifunctional glycosyltransferase family 2/GtrA family protein [Candidatus Staskawiczbacteria bacterium]|nr:bifunctional glycosyltransferase family 2/GtrA family protein [Candidatus Staskawiczbacteria bacterium]
MRKKILTEEIIKTNNKIRLVSHDKNLGYGKALLSGIKAARYDYVFFTDGDLQFDINEINKFLEYIPEYKTVVGYRFPREGSLMRVMNTKMWNALNRYVFGLKIKDADCAFKLFERKTVANLNILSGGAMTSAEILLRLQRAGVKIKEIPVKHLPRKNGSPTGAKLSVIIRALKEFVWLYLNTELGNKVYIQATKFIFVGLANTLVDVFFYFVLTRGNDFFSTHIISARTISFLLGSACSFILNRLWTFKKEGKTNVQEISKFYITVFFGLLISVGSMKFFIQVFHLYDLVALLLSVVITFLWNFSLSKLWVFKK